ncbi:MAG: hypothetical protein ABJA67_14395 [Chthonomonadales bacterium]
MIAVLARESEVEVGSGTDTVDVEEPTIGSIWQELMVNMEAAKKGLREGSMEASELRAMRAWEIYITNRQILDVYAGRNLRATLDSLAEECSIDVAGLMGWFMTGTYSMTA